MSSEHEFSPFASETLEVPGSPTLALITRVGETIERVAGGASSLRDFRRMISGVTQRRCWVPSAAGSSPVVGAGCNWSSHEVFVTIKCDLMIKFDSKCCSSREECRGAPPAPTTWGNAVPVPRNSFYGFAVSAIHGPITSPALVDHLRVTIMACVTGSAGFGSRPSK